MTREPDAASALDRRRSAAERDIVAVAVSIVDDAGEEWKQTRAGKAAGTREHQLNP
jgi:uncharacterized protein GlcG (DUF336 family)